MDVRMPEMDGLEATRRIRALSGKRGQVPIVALTAQTFQEQLEECRQAAMDGYLPKPFNPDALLAAVVRASVQGRTHSENFGPAPGSDAPIGRHYAKRG
jgi:CheY-like chemotaxis protein